MTNACERGRPARAIPRGSVLRRSPASPQVVRSSCFAVTLGLRVAREQRHGVPPDSELNSERAVAVRNLQRKAPKHAREEIADDFHRVVDAESEAAARVAWTAFEKKWRPRCPGAVKSLAEGGDELLTFFRYPKSQWKTIRTTNVIERLNGEFRRRVKTQAHCLAKTLRSCCSSAWWRAARSNCASSTDSAASLRCSACGCNGPRDVREGCYKEQRLAGGMR